MEIAGHSGWKQLLCLPLIAPRAALPRPARHHQNERGALAVIPTNGSRAGLIPYDTEIYKWRHLVENFFQKLKEFRRIATRYDKTDTSFRAAIHLVAIFLALK